jgi:6-phosphofructo-2-kinase
MPHAVSWDDLFTSSALAARHNHLPSSHSDGDVSPTDTENVHFAGKCSCVLQDNSDLGQFRRRQSQQATSVKSDMETHITNTARRSRSSTSSDVSRIDDKQFEQLRSHLTRTLTKPPATSAPRSEASSEASTDLPEMSGPSHQRGGSLAAAMQGTLQGVHVALNDTPTSTAPNSPLMSASTTSDGPPPVNLLAPMLRPRSGSATPRIRPTTLDIPGLTKSKVSPDGRISQRDVGSKLVIVMVSFVALQIFRDPLADKDIRLVFPREERATSPKSWPAISTGCNTIRGSLM